MCKLVSRYNSFQKNTSHATDKWSMYKNMFHSIRMPQILKGTCCMNKVGKLHHLTELLGFSESSTWCKVKTDFFFVRRDTKETDMKFEAVNT